MKAWIYAMMLGIGLFVGPLTISMTTTGCSTIGTAAEGTGDVAGQAIEDTGDVIKDTAETAEDELD